MRKMLKKSVLLSVLSFVVLHNKAFAETKVERLIRVIQEQLINPFITFLFIVATFVFIWGIIEFIAGASNEEARTNGKKHMMWGIIGLGIMLSVKLIIEVFKAFFASIK
jgi:hypothetical protein